MTSDRTYRVFVSHGGEDTYIVRRFLEPRIASTGASAFLDAGRLEYGDDFRERILFELGRADELLVLLTTSSIRRPWVIAEVGAALVRRKRVVALRYGPSEAQLHELGFGSLLGTTNVLHIGDFEAYVDQLGRRVREHHDE